VKADVCKPFAWYEKTRVSRIVYAHTVEGLLFRALKGRVPPQLRSSLKELGVDLDDKPKDLPHEVWVKVLAAGVRTLHPNLPPDEGYFRLGRTLIDGYEQTLMGKALIGMMKLLGPLRTVRRVMVNLRNGNSYSEATAKELGPTHHEIWINECNGNPGYIRGVLFAAIEKSGAKNLKIVTKGVDGPGATFDVTWD
jgi:uncharacterized protein (TIGR02265 family)